jgi:hypothetical protein
MLRRYREEEAGMSMRATGTFEIGGWDEEPYDEREGAKLSRTRVTKVFRGDVEGESVADLLMAYGAEEGSAAYAGFERVVGSAHGRSGSFVLHHSATMTRGEGESSLSVVPDSATGKLRGLRGTARISREPDGGHSFTLDYDL